MIAALFIGVLLCVLEVGLYMFAQNVLQAATVQAGRLFLTGQAQTSGLTQAQLVQSICPSVQSFFDCNGLMIDLQAYSSFSGASTGKPTITFNGSGQVSNTWNYTPGSQGQVVVLRVMYQWPVIVAPYALVVPTLANNKTLIMGITAFRVEPY
jgi:Flp pilus assembly protein TadG